MRRTGEGDCAPSTPLAIRLLTSGRSERVHVVRQCTILLFSTVMIEMSRLSYATPVANLAMQLVLKDDDALILQSAPCRIDGTATEASTTSFVRVLSSNEPAVWAVVSSNGTTSQPPVPCRAASSRRAYT